MEGRLFPNNYLMPMGFELIILDFKPPKTLCTTIFLLFEDNKNHPGQFL